MSFGSTNRAPTPPRKLGNLDGDSLNTDQESIPVPYMAGRRLMTFIWIIPGYNQVDETKRQGGGGKGQPQTTTTTQYIDMAGVLCVGGRRPGDKIYKFIVDEETPWQNPSGLARDEDPYEPVTIPNFATARNYWGAADQPVDTLVLTPRGVLPPGALPRDTSTWPNYNQWNQHPH